MIKANMKATQVFRCAIGAIALCVALSAVAMSGLEFIQLDSGSATAQVVEPIIVRYVSYGYKNVPSWAALAGKMRELIRKNGYRYKSVDEIAEEAAVELGMTK